MFFFRKKQLYSIFIMIIGFYVLVSYSQAQVRIVKHKTPQAQIKVIYGEDNRKDIYEVNDQNVRNLAASTAVLFNASDVIPVQGGYKLRGESFGKAMNLCKDEPFYEQPSGGFCSGFLVGEDTFVTAGHCIRSEQACKNVRFVFNYAVYQKGVMPTEVSTDDVYECKKIIARKELANGADYAVVQLDRPNKKYRPLQVNHTRKIKPGTDVMVIGYPAGIPVKVSDGAKVRSVEDGYFVANLDTYGGNSGSAVFNVKTGLVEGILVRGEQDYVYRNGCYVSNRCDNDDCRGEDVTKIGELLDYIPKN